MFFLCLIPSLLSVCFVFVFFFWRVWGQLRLPKGPPHLSPNLPWFCFILFNFLSSFHFHFLFWWFGGFCFFLFCFDCLCFCYCELFCFVFVISVVSLVLLSNCEHKHCFPAILVLFIIMYFSSMLLFLFFVVLFASFKMKLECLMCVLCPAYSKHKTRLFAWSGFVVWFLFAC